jgi:two-component system OmpR family sensor kinase
VLQLVVGALASLAFAALLAWYMTRPIRTLKGAFEAAAQGRLDTRVQPLMGRRRDEIADLGGDFDRMVQQVEALVASQQRLLHDVSHELRSPLARVQVATDLARQNPARLEASLDRIDREAARLDHLIGQMLTLSRLEAGTEVEAPTVFDLTELVSMVIDDARFETRSDGPLRHRELHWQQPGPVAVELRAELIHRAIENVVRNALKFTGEGTAVDVILTRLPDRRHVRLEVADRGPGISPDRIATLFKPFHRGPGTRGVDGFGLGLAIAYNAVRRHDGTIEARPRPDGGLVVRIDLPCLQTAPVASAGAGATDPAASLADR